MKRTYTYQSAAGLSKWIVGVVWLFVLVQASIIAFAAFALFTFISILQPVKAVLENNQQLTELNVDFMAIVTSSIILDYVDKGVYLLAAIFIGCWIVRAHSNAQSFHIPNLLFSPAWALGGFFVPFLNLVAPYIAMNQLYQGSLKRAQHNCAPALLPCWWVTFLIGRIGGQIALFYAIHGAQGASITSFITIIAPELLNALNTSIVANTAIIFSSVCQITCALLLLRIIQQINRAHATLHAANTSETAIAPVKAA